MNDIHEQGKRKYLILGLIVTAGFTAYVIRATSSGLWYDEGVEYFFSKYTTGIVPGSIGTSGMYENIISTYQPPLYNVLMHLWLTVFDSEFLFRLAGIITTFVGTIGIFKAIDEQLKDDIWTEIGTLMYVFTSSVVYYALECAEYNLMLCCLAWTTYFYVRFMKRRDISSLAGFFVFAVLSVYSQYGAAFLVCGMYVSIFAAVFRNRRLLLADLAATGITLAAAAFPLICFFLIPQVTNQTRGVSHIPVFHRNFAVDYVIGAIKVLRMGFSFNGAPYIRNVILGGVCAAVLFVLIDVFCRKKEIYHFAAVILITYTMYFAAVACSVYGYNNWDGRIGTQNLGGRYTLFFVPFVTVTLVAGTKYFFDSIKEKKIYRPLQWICIIGAAAFCLGEIVELNIIGWEKDDIREVTMAWYQNKAYETPTLLHQWDDAMFHFYLIHDDRYDASYRENIKSMGLWSREADYRTMSEQLENMGYFDMPEFYYVLPLNMYPNSLTAFRQAAEDHEFRIEEIYEGNSALWHVIKY